MNSSKSSKIQQAADRTFFNNLFTSIAEEMGVSLARTAYSPNIKERRDFSCALFDTQGQMIAQAAHIPVHLGAMPMSVKYALDRFPNLVEGDVIMLNDPFAGGTHLPDVTMLTPVIDPQSQNKQAIAYLATRAHHADVGGMSPGSLPLSRDIFQEGIRIPPIKWHDAGNENQSVLDLFLSNVRTPEERRGDLRAQLAAHKTGENRLLEAMEKYGAATIQNKMNDLLEYGNDLMKAILKAIPNGEYSFEDVLEDDGITNQPITIRVRITIKGSKAKVDFTGTDSQCSGSMNAVEAITRSAVYYCFLCLLVTPSETLSTVADPPLNSGCFMPIHIVAPEGTVINAKPPAAVAGGNVETSQRIVDVVFGALAQALPNLIPAASQGTMNNLTLGGYDPINQRNYAYYETIGGGMGARPGLDGISGVQVHMTNTLNTPAEALEFAYPLRLEKYALADNTGGRGKYRGGNGIERDLRLLCDAQGALLSERRKSKPYGLHGGTDGKSGQNSILRDGKTIKLTGKTLLELKKGDILKIRTPSGGGWGKK